MKWTDAQQKIIDSRGSNLLVAAAAGSGKTAVLVERIIRMIMDESNPVDVDRLLVVTFTNAAASQMREKISKALEEKLEIQPENEHLVKQISLLNRANIMTIDSFCLKVVKENFNIIGIDPNMRIADGGEIDLLKADVMDKLLEKKYIEGREEFIRFVDGFSGDKSDEKIENIIENIYRVSSSYPYPEQWLNNAKEAISINTEEELCGTLWFKKLYEYIQKNLEDITLTINYCMEICDKPLGPYMYKKTALEDMKLFQDMQSARTYSQLVDAFNIKFPRLAQCRDVDIDKDLVNEFKDSRDNYKNIYKSINYFNKPIEEVIEEFSGIKESVEEIIDLTLEFRNMFAKAKMDKGIMDFSDVEHMALNILCYGYNEENKIVPSKTGIKLSEDFVEIFIDEYQDSNYLQENILLCVSKINKGINNMFMVGDVKQSIYRFRMARPDLFLDKYNSYGDTGDSIKIELKNNFRSRGVVLEAINYIFYQIMDESIGGIDYNTEVALVPSREFDDTEENISTNTELMIIDTDGDSKLDDIELEAKSIALRIQKLTGNVGNAPTLVWDSELGKYRNAEYRDIVILLRSPKSMSNTFIKVLSDEGILAHTFIDSGYFDTVEVNTVLCFLSIVDNAYLDIELASVLRSYIGRFSEEELAIIKIRQKRYRKDRSLYRAVVEYAENGDNQIIAEKLRLVISLLTDFKHYRKHMSINDMLCRFFQRTGYYEYVGMMPSGKKRQSNLMLLLEKANSYEQTSYKGLFNFLRYIDKLKKYDLDFGEVNVVGEQDNIVRIMSMHKSKGLEFPIVFVSGLGKQFNNSETRENIIIHSDYFLAPKLVNVDEMRKSDTFLRKVISQSIKLENIAESLRILYVAMTRAEEKLILTGCVKNVASYIRSYINVDKNNLIRLSYSDVINSKGYLEWIIKALIRNKDFNEFANSIEAVPDKKGDGVIDCGYELNNELKADGTSFSIRLFNNESLDEINLYNQVEGIELASVVDELVNSGLDNGDYETLLNKINWIYPNEQVTKVKGKVSVTELKKMSQVVDGDYIMDTLKEEREIKYPRFIKEPEIAPTTIGTAIHKVMELIEFQSISDKEQVDIAIDAMASKGYIDQELVEKMSSKSIYNMINSSLGKRMAKAEKAGKLYKEKQFVAGLPMEYVYGFGKSDDTVIIQGIVDAYFVEDNKIIIVDYKSDKAYGKKGKEELIKKYRSQLDYYAKILEQLTGLEVTEKYIYSFMLEEAILI